MAPLLICGSLGPVTGPLVLGLARALRNGDRVLAALYVVAIPCAWALLSFAAAWSVTRWA